MSRPSIAIGAALTVVISALVVLAFPAPDSAEDLKLAEQEQARGNFKVAAELHRKILSDAQSPAEIVAQSLGLLRQCLLSLGSEVEFDADLGAAIQVHGDDYRVLSAAAEALSESTPYGIIADQAFSRGYNQRNRGINVNVVEQDRLQTLKWRTLAVQAALKHGLAAESAELGQIYLDYAKSWLQGREYKQAWRLQAKTDLDTVPNYTDLDAQAGFAHASAPVDASGDPILYHAPESFEDAKSDGERFRWALEQAKKSKATSADAQLLWANFLQAQFSVDTLQEDLWILRSKPSGPATEDILAIHSLAENETIAKLANGVKRFELADEFNPIRVYQEIALEGASSAAQSAAWSLVDIFMNRRQYPKAAELIEAYLERFADDNETWRKDLLDGIRQPRISFDALQPQLAGKQAEISLVFRNATNLQLSAHRVDLEKILADTKSYYRSLRPGGNQNFGGKPGQSPPSLQSPGELFQDLEMDKYLLGNATRWEAVVQPRANHWDKRIELSAPLTNAGLYLVEARAMSGNENQTAHRARCLVWIHDTVMIRKPLETGTLLQVVDSSTGDPLTGANVELFGWRFGNNNNNRSNGVELQNFAARTDASGLATVNLENGYQWLTVARTADGRLAILDFESFYRNRSMPEEYRQAKAYGVSDRPVYRPGERVKAKFWLAYAVYGDLQAPRMANSKATIAMFDALNQRVAEQVVTTDAYGGCDVEFQLPPSASLGRYHFRVEATGNRNLRPPLRNRGIPNPANANFNQGNQPFDTSLAIRVEEYRKPEFEVNVLAPQEPVALGETIQARIQAKYYFGAPVTDAEVQVRVQRTSFSEQYFPAATFDWCYGPGYWWFAEDYDWYPNWQRWRGCVAPEPWWIGPWGPAEPPELVLEQTLTLDATGEATLSIDTAVAKAIFGDQQDHRYDISVEVRDASRRTITGQGQVIAAREAFKIYSWVDRGYYRVGDPINADFHARMLDGTNVAARGKLELLRISYDASFNPTERLVAGFDAATDSEGRFTQRLVANEAGQYRLRLRLTDEAGHEVEGGYVFTVRGEGLAGKDFRYSGIELTPDRREYQPGDTVQLLIAADREDALVALFVRPANGHYAKPTMIRLESKSAVLKIAVTEADQPNFFVEAYTIYDGQVHRKVREIVVPPAERVMNVAMSSNKSEYLPGEEAQVTVEIKDLQGKPAQGSCVIAVYDRSLEQIAPDVLPQDIRAFFWKWRRNFSPQHRDNTEVATYPIHLIDQPVWQALGIFGDSLADDFDAMEGIQSPHRAEASGQGPFGVWGARGRPGAGMGGGYGGGAMAMSADSMQMEMSGAPMSRALAIMDEAPGKAAGAASDTKIAVRKDFADSALWLANVQTDAAGKATAKFKMPENLTGWKMQSWAVGSDTRVGSASTEATTRKPLLVRLQVPRFLVERDEIIFSTIVHNDLPATRQVRVELQIDGETQVELMPGVEAIQTVDIRAHEQARVDWRCKAIAEGSVTIRTTATTHDASDAMQLQVPILVNGMLKTDSWAGTVRREQDASTITIHIPEQRRVAQSKLTVRLSPSLAAAMMDALPYLAAYPYGCTEQTLNRFLPTVITQKVLQNMNVDLGKLRAQKANLNAQELGAVSERRDGWQRYSENPIYDSNEIASMVDTGVRKLTSMQNGDGGWGWFPGADSRSTAHLTATVLRGLLIAQANDVAIVPDVIQRGTQWLVQFQQEEKLRLQNWDAKTKPFKQFPDNVDVLVFHVLVQAGNVDSEMQNILFERRQQLGVYGKALLAWATHTAGNAQQTALLRQNIEQFLVQDVENETAYLEDTTAWWYWYGSPIEASAMYLKLLSAQEPNGLTASRLVKYLLNNRKHATYWNSTRDSALVVEAFGDYLKATGETNASMTAEVRLDGKRIGSVEFTPENLFEVNNTLEIIAAAIPSGEHKLEIKRIGGGNLYWNVYATNFTLQDEIEEAGLEVKIERRYYQLKPIARELTLSSDRGSVESASRAAYDRLVLEDLQELESGTLVEVELLVESKNDYEYILIEDRKPASLETVDTTSGYFYSGGLHIYRELRDQHVGLCIERLPRGRYSIRYQLRSEAPGIFTALPATIEGMYAPELVGNSKDFDLHVVE